MSFWNPWNDNQNSNTSNAFEQTNHHNPSESLNKLIHTDLFNNIDTSNLNDKFTFLDDTCNQLLANESLNQSKIKESPVEIKEEQEEEQEQQDANFFPNQYQQFYQARYTPSVSSQHAYLPEDQANYLHYQTTCINNLRPSSVVSSASSNDYSSDFDSSISSSSTDCRRYSPNIYINHQANLRNQQLASLPYPTYHDPGAFTYGNEFYYQSNIDPNYYYYNQFRHQPSAKPGEPLSSLSRSQSTQSLNLFQPFEEPQMKLPVAQSKPKTIQSIPKPPVDVAKKKTTPNVNDLNAFKYPSTNKVNPNVKISLQDFDLWTQFKQLGTEMIITKSGR